MGLKLPRLGLVVAELLPEGGEFGRELEVERCVGEQLEALFELESERVLGRTTRGVLMGRLGRRREVRVEVLFERGSKASR